MEKLPKIHKCECNHGQLMKCANVAKYSVVLRTRSNEGENAQKVNSYRCENHKNKGTTNRKVIEQTPLNQDDNLKIVYSFLRSLVGKTISSSYHTAKELEVKYVKENCAVMCLQPITKKYKLVYYNQINHA